jgi:ABC-type multidrug transport system ATPase subunit
VSFAYPGTDRSVLEDVDLDLRAGSVVALVGENGAGKTTLVKLLCAFYAPSDGPHHRRRGRSHTLPARGWRDRLSGAFQDFFRFEYAPRSARSASATSAARRPSCGRRRCSRAGAAPPTSCDGCRHGLDTQLGPTWRDGVELSIGQWQKLALARGLHARAPARLRLDEPTAALDAGDRARALRAVRGRARAARADGRITVLVSHRFSTVRMADQIVVLDGARVVEVGSARRARRAGRPLRRALRRRRRAPTADSGRMRTCRFDHVVHEMVGRMLPVGFGDAVVSMKVDCVFYEERADLHGLVAIARLRPASRRTRSAAAPRAERSSRMDSRARDDHLSHDARLSVSFPDGADMRVQGDGAVLVRTGPRGVGHVRVLRRRQARRIEQGLFGFRARSIGKPFHRFD